MIVRLKFALILGLAVIGLTGLLETATRVTLLERYQHLEAQAAQDQVMDALNTLNLLMEAFSRANQSWAHRDDTYAYLLTANPAYEAAHLTREQFVTLGVSLVVYIRRDGRVIYSTGFDPAGGQFLPTPNSLRSYLTPGSPLLNLPEGTGTINGLLLLPEIPLLVVAHTVLPSDRNGLPRGVLLWGRALDASVIDILSEITSSTVMLRPWNETAPPGDFQAVRPRLTVQPTVIQTITDDRLASYTVLNDITGQPAMIMRMVIPRTLIQQGQANLHDFRRLLLVITVSFAGLMWLLLDHFIIGRVVRLASDLHRLYRSGDPTARLALHGHDELGPLADDLNDILARLYRTEAIADENALRLQLIATGAPVIVFALNRVGAFTMLAGKIQELIGKSIDSLVGSTIHEERIHQPMPWLEQVYKAGLRGQTVTMEVMLGGAVFSLWCTPQRDKAGTIVGVFGVATDITALKNAQQQLSLMAGDETAPAQPQANSDNFNPSGVQS